MTTASPVLELQNVHKTFGGITAVEDFSLDLHAGEIVALVGDNGAGKSTLVKIVSGVHAPTSGSIRLEGEDVSFADASMARSLGIEVVYQDLALADQQPVYMNLFLGREAVRGPLRLLDRKKMMRETQQLVDDLDVRIPVSQGDNPRPLRWSAPGRGDRPCNPLGEEAHSSRRTDGGTGCRRNRKGREDRCLAQGA